MLTDYLGGVRSEHHRAGGRRRADRSVQRRRSGSSPKRASRTRTAIYLVNHTASVFLIGKDGSFQGTIAYGEDKASALAKIKRLVGA